jgi:hypothetical protein
MQAKEQEVLGLIGVKGAGKDTAATTLIEQFGFERVAFADALYREVAEAFGVSVEFLGNRDTKELAQDELKLLNCTSSEFVSTALDIAEEEGLELDVRTPLSPRWVLQLWGTEFRRIREGHDSYWLDRVNDIIRANPTVNFVVTDVRFVNEARYITNSLGGKLIRIRRPVLEAKEALARAANGTAAHRSEVELLTYPTDLEAINVEGQMDSLSNALVNWYTQKLAA